MTAPITAASPTGPAPSTTSVDPGLHAIELITAPAPVCSPHPSGPSRLMSSADSTLTTLRRWAIACVAKDDWLKKCPCTSPSSPESAFVPSALLPM